MAQSRSGRRLVYVNQVPYETDVLYTNMYKMVDVSNLAQAVLGGAGTSNATLASGLICSPNSPPDLTVYMGTGVIYKLVTLDATAYGSIPSDTADFLYKPFTQVSSAVHVTGFTAPVSGTTNYLIQAAPTTSDTDSESRPYYNSADPENPIYQTATQTRLDSIVYSLKSAVSPAVPTPDAGNIGLYVVAVANGQTTIVGGDITVYSGAPFITESLTQKISQTSGDARYVRPIQVQNQTYVYGNATSTANAYSLTLSPAVTSYVAGLKVEMKVDASNTGASTLNINGLGAATILNNKGGALYKDDLRTDRLAVLTCNGTDFILENPSSSSSVTFVGATMRMGGPAQTIAVATKLNFDTVESDPYSLCNTGASTITAPVTGFYFISVICQFVNAAGASMAGDIQIAIGGVSTKRIAQQTLTTNADSCILSGSGILSLSAGNVISMIATPSAANGTFGSGTSNLTQFAVQFLGAP